MLDQEEVMGARTRHERDGRYSLRKQKKKKKDVYTANRGSLLGHIILWQSGDFAKGFACSIAV